ncbi:hypothetical protein CRG98_031030 [Punica granatum]|uniref:Uncharacterized protein n=1 Tax=Punica granatum TaxID=22663 RepID=A0A2I0IX62_PUNGR|nr:hypothetical protein CRG98_031030 [Punica granatum]
MGCRWAGPMRGRTGQGGIPAESGWAGLLDWAATLGRAEGASWTGAACLFNPEPSGGCSGFRELWASERINELRVSEFQPLKT